MNAAARAEFLVLTTVVARDGDAARDLVDHAVTTAEALRDVPGVIAVRVHLSDDGTTVLHACWWDHPDSCAQSVAPEPFEPVGDEVLSRHQFRGRSLLSIRGSDHGRPAGVLVVASRPVEDHAAADRLAALLRGSEEHKATIPGFVGAWAYLSTDGRTFLNYPGWTDRDAFARFMQDPGVLEEQAVAGAQGREAASFVLCTVRSEVTVDARGTGTPR